MTALRTVATKSTAEIERERVKAEISDAAYRQLKDHIHTDPKVQEELFGRIMSRAIDQFADRTKHLKRSEFARGALVGALVSAGLVLMSTAYVYERAGMWGAAIERFEGHNAELKAIKDGQ